MTKKELINKFLTLGEELSKADGFNALMIVNDAVLSLDEYSKNLQLNVKYDDDVYKKAIKYTQENYCDNYLSTPYMLLGNVVELIKITTGKKIELNDLIIDSK